MLAALTLSVTAYAQQNLRTAYFLDGYTYSYKFNPSFQGERGFLAIPVLGKTGVGVESNMALSSFLYPTGKGTLTTFLSPNVSADDFSGSLKEFNRMNINVDIPVFAVGFYTGKLFHTIDISARADAGIGLPKSLFCFMKEGASDGVDKWDINNIGARADARLELAYGASCRLFDFINVGARLKMLVGVISADLLMNNVNLKMAADEWSVSADGELLVNGPFDIDESLDFESITYPASFEDLKNMEHSTGFAVDLGVSADFLEYFTASASVLDLGSIGWKQGFSAHTPSGAEPWRFTGFGEISHDGNNTSVEDQIDAMVDDLMTVFNLTKSDDHKPGRRPLGATAHLGLEARMPFYERLSFGLLGTRRFDGSYSWTEGRISANIAPANAFSASCSYAVSTYGSSLGAAINLHSDGLTFFAGLDSFLPLFSVTPQFIPVNRWNTNLTLGLNLTIGNYKGRFPKIVK